MDLYQASNDDRPKSEKSAFVPGSEEISGTKNTSTRTTKVAVIVLLCSMAILSLGVAMSYSPRKSSTSSNLYTSIELSKDPGSITTVAGPPRFEVPATLRWGIVGPGRIARDFAAALKIVNANITAVAAGSLPNPLDRAREFAEIFDVPHFYGTYEELAKDPEVDIVYICTTNQLHFENTIMMLQHGKNVLVEKPMAMNLVEATAMFNEAKKQNRLLLTNFWTRFFPAIIYARDAIASGRLGQLVSMEGDFSFPAIPTPNDRFLNPAAGGGAMLDMGCYLLTLAIMVSPPNMYPTTISATGQTDYLGHDYGVDTETGFVLNWKGQPAPQDADNGLVAEGAGAKRAGDVASIKDHTVYPGAVYGVNGEYDLIAVAKTSLRHPSSFEVEFAGTHGRIRINSPANCPESVTIVDYHPALGPGDMAVPCCGQPTTKVETYKSPIPEFPLQYGPPQYPQGSGFVYVIMAVEACLAKEGKNGGCLELAALTTEEQLRTVAISDEILGQVMGK